MAVAAVSTLGEGDGSSRPDEGLPVFAVVLFLRCCVAREDARKPRAPLDSRLWLMLRLRCGHPPRPAGAGHTQCFACTGRSHGF